MFRKLDNTADQLCVFLDGEPAYAESGESVAAFLLRQPGTWSRTTPVSGAKRGPFCMMGVCFECLATIDGVSSTQTCLTQVRDGMRIDRQLGRRSVEQ
ncbi:(2Fe-2S)-binding protein [Celeribacter sp.]|uniref:(2Fe-2S)-binding protein n=1 Tax=Celeribacter sp. TaxID=1890673 RepID=UPI003A8D1628